MIRPFLQAVFVLVIAIAIFACTGALAEPSDPMPTPSAAAPATQPVHVLLGKGAISVTIPPEFHVAKQADDAVECRTQDNLVRMDIRVPNQFTRASIFAKNILTPSTIDVGRTTLPGHPVVQEDSRFQYQIRLVEAGCHGPELMLRRGRQMGIQIVCVDITCESTNQIPTLFDELAAQTLLSAKVVAKQPLPDRTRAINQEAGRTYKLVFPSQALVNGQPPPPTHADIEAMLVKLTWAEEDARPPLRPLGPEGEQPAASPTTRPLACKTAASGNNANSNASASAIHPAEATKASKPDPAAQAKSMLSMADSYANAGRTDLARGKYLAIIEQFPGTPTAAAAKQKLVALDAK
jgi:hypothetical protein